MYISFYLFIHLTLVTIYIFVVQCKHCIIINIVVINCEKMSVCRASQSINLPQLQNLIKRDPESYRDEVCTVSALCL